MNIIQLFEYIYYIYILYCKAKSSNCLPLKQADTASGFTRQITIRMINPTNVSPTLGQRFLFAGKVATT